MAFASLWPEVLGRQQTKSACVEERERGVDKNREYDGYGWYEVLLSIR